MLNKVAPGCLIEHLSGMPNSWCKMSQIWFYVGNKDLVLPIVGIEHCEWLETDSTHFNLDMISATTLMNSGTLTFGLEVTPWGLIYDACVVSLQKVVVLEPL